MTTARDCRARKVVSIVQIGHASCRQVARLQALSTSYSAITEPLRSRSSLRGMELHLIADDLRDHAWYEQLFVKTIADVETFAGRWAAFEEIVFAVEPETAGNN